MELAASTTDHEITPLRASARRLGGAHADLMNPAHYPVEALCVQCGQPIRCERCVIIGAVSGENWIHLDKFSLAGD